MKFSTTGVLTVDRREFSDQHLLGKLPVLVTDALEDWPAVERWSPEKMGSLAPHGLVDLLVSLNGSFRANPDGSAVDPKNQFLLRDVKFSRAAQEIMLSETSGAKYYISQQNIFTKLPELVPDLRCWWPIEGSAINLWFGSAGVITPLHFDNVPNLFAQIYGTKRFTIFAPDQSKYLYPYPAESALAHVSHVDVEMPTSQEHADYSFAERNVAVVRPGEMLFLPPLWWHHVESLTISISVNQWRILNK